MQFPFVIPENKEFDAVGFGTNAVDFLVIVPEYPAFGSKIELIRYHQLPGGEVASTMTGLSRLGLKVAYVGRFGNDSAGEFGIQSLKDENVNIDYVEIVPNAKTQIAFIIIDEKNGERTVIWKRDKLLAYSSEKLPLQAVEKCKVFHTTPHDTQACILMAKHAKSAGAITSVDVDKPFDGIEVLIPLIDIFICAEEFPYKFLGIEDKEIALKEIKSRYGCSIIGVTLGKEGSLILCQDKLIRTQGFCVPGGCKDTTGAGDAFRAGFLYGLLTGETVEQTAVIANAVAALKCREVGARTALPTREELCSFLSQL